MACDRDGQFYQMSGLAQSTITTYYYASHPLGVYHKSGISHKVLLNVKCAFILGAVSIKATSHRYEMWLSGRALTQLTQTQGFYAIPRKNKQQKFLFQFRISHASVGPTLRG